ncbi:hypothetical protein SEA_DAUBENSKI_227 [Streptomyces phage Daubenski]|uniref:Uncharacterized protein n=1 Tax=Streptomyces phage Daubenski TaxID=2653725 RepID=A0A5Q2WHZ3_9CAUD|nr:hypothetical protein KNU80_gp078 [Streptomyces phage Daubenski]QGH76494.1 hypothetical protein SEA_DAUBENSKI_227 [Streptomyces phage Daubenski]
MADYVFTDHKGKKVHRGDRVKVYRTPKGQEAWLNCKGTVTSIVLPGGDNLVQLFDLDGKPSSYSDRFVYHPYQYLEKA